MLVRTDKWLRSKGVENPRLESELLLSHALGVERLGLYLAHDRPLDPTEVDAIRVLVRRRGAREPLAWILGTQAFHAIELEVGPGVLVPRPDTETLVEAALGWLDRIAPALEPVYVADVGCGSGAVGLALAAARTRARVYCTDVADEPLACTRRNVARLGLADRVAVLRGDLLGPIPDRRPLDLVVSNPPYIPTGDIGALMPEVSRFEPRLALDGGEDGLFVLRRLVRAAIPRARHGVLLEVGVRQAPHVAELLRRAGAVEIEIFDDLAGIARVVAGRTALPVPA